MRLLMSGLDWRTVGLLARDSRNDSLAPPLRIVGEGGPLIKPQNVLSSSEGF